MILGKCDSCGAVEPQLYCTRGSLVCERCLDEYGTIPRPVLVMAVAIIATVLIVAGFIFFRSL